jgi:hypothetical protein
MNFAKLKESTVASISKGRATASHYLAEKSNKAIEIILKDLSCLNDILKTLNCRVENASLIMKSAGLPEISVDIDRGEGLDVNALEAAAGDGERSVGVRAALKALLMTTKLDAIVDSHGMRPGFVRINISANPLAESIEVGLRFNE